MADVIISEFMDPGAVAALGEDFDVVYDPSLVDERERLVGLLEDARALIVRNRTSVDAALLANAPRLQVVGRLGVGLDNIDLDACRQRGVAVRPATGANADAVVEYVIAAMFMLRRGVFTASDRVIAGEWPRTVFVGNEVTGATMGLIGLGDIARRVSLAARALGMDVIAYDPYVGDGGDLAAMVPLDHLLVSADVVSVHVPLTDQTAGLIGADAFTRMGPDTVLINTSRGGIIDEYALIEALSVGRIAGAALDVFATEPVSSVTGSRFSGVPNLILTPHIAGITVESNTRVSEMVADAVRSHLTGGDSG